MEHITHQVPGQADPITGHKMSNAHLYLVTPWPNTLYALDLTRPGAPMKRAYEPKPVAAAKGVACCD
jgi:hypothetical protein